MKKDLHPKYTMVKVTLADGSTFETRSTMGVEEYTSDVDSTNHPFYTGKRQYVDTAGRVEKFLRRYGDRGRPTTPNAEGGEAENAEAENPEAAE